MNKKLIAIAVASVMAAPAAMADIKISGRVGLHFTTLDVDAPATEDVRQWSDKGHTRIQFDGTSGDAYARLAYNDANQLREKMRDMYVGYKFGGGMSVQAGRMPGAVKNLEKDPYIATFLQTRGTAAESSTGKGYGSSSFVDNVVQLSMKAGPANVKIQYDASENAGPNDGHIGLSVAGKAGAVNYWAGYNNGTADGAGAATTSPSNIKVGAAMKFGAVKVTLNYTSMDFDGVVGEGNATDSIFVGANMGFGNGLSGDVSVAVRSGDVAADDATLLRVAVMKKLSKGASVYAGLTTTDFDEASADADTSELGLGMVVKF